MSSAIYTMKAQLEIMQNMFVLIILVMMFFGGIVFYAWYASGNVSESQYEYMQREQIETSVLLQSLPEIACTKYADCIDLQRIKHFDAMAGNKQYYRDLFGKIVLTVEMYNNTVWTEHVLYSNPDAALDVRTIRHPVLIYDPVSDKKFYGHMDIEVYS